MRARFKPEDAKKHPWSEYAGHECLIEERSSGGDFSVMVLGQGDVGKTLKRKDPNTVINQVAWVDEDELEWVDSNLKKNMGFFDWYEENEENFCGDCGAWFPDKGRINLEADEDFVCPNEECAGRLYDSGVCPHCKVPAVNDECPECGFEFDL